MPRDKDGITRIGLPQDADVKLHTANFKIRTRNLSLDAPAQLDRIVRIVRDSGISV